MPAKPDDEQAAFEAMLRENQSRVRQQLRRLTQGDAALADDLAQETFVQAWLHRAAFRGEARVSTWLYRIAYRAFLIHRRTPYARSLAVEEVEAAELPSRVVGDPSLRLDVEHALARLPEPERIALIHCFQLDLSHGEAAAVLGWPLGTFKSHVARGKARLRERLAAWQGEGAT